MIRLTIIITTISWTLGSPIYENVFQLPGLNLKTGFLSVIFKEPSGVLVRESTDVLHFGKYLGRCAGMVVHIGVDYNFGCSSPVQFNQVPSRPIALIHPGVCSFGVKLKNLLPTNVSCIIIYDNDEPSVLDRDVIHSLRRSNINGAFISNSKGETLVRLLKVKKTTVLASLTVPFFMGGGSANESGSTYAFASSAIVGIMMLVLALLTFFVLSRCARSTSSEKAEETSGSDNSLSRLPVKMLTEQDKEVNCIETVCSICLESYKNKDFVRTLTCNHVYHQSCIDPWILDKRTCPMCKRDILNDVGFIFTGSIESIIDMYGYAEEAVGSETDSNENEATEEPDADEPLEEITVENNQRCDPPSESELIMN